MNSHRLASRTRGSVLILVVVMLVLMVLLGTAYLQVSRIDREATAGNSGDILRVRDDTIQLIQSTLIEDLFDPASGQLFNGGNSNEPYDYPGSNGTRTVKDRGGNDRNVKGGSSDDYWLAATAPVFNTAATSAPMVWPHITNLTGIFLRLPAFNNAAPTLPEEDLIDDNGPANVPRVVRTDTNVAVFPGGSTTTGLALPSNSSDQTGGTIDNQFLDLGADVDGDGVPDSRWAYARVPRIGGIEYVMAVRIIDNSSLINLNTATVLGDPRQEQTNPTTYFGTLGKASALADVKSPRGYYPSDLDLARILNRTSAASPLADLQTWLNERGITYNYSATDPIEPFGMSASLPALPAPPNFTIYTRSANWLQMGRFYGNNAQNNAPYRQILSIDDERELRHRNGLNSPTNAEIETHLPTVTRKTNGGTTGEVSYWQVLGLGAEPTDNTTRAANMAKWFQGDSTYSIAERITANATVADARKYLTTRSGAALFSPNFGNIHGGNRVLKYDLNNEYPGTTNALKDTRVTALAERLKVIFQAGATNYLGQSDPAAADIAKEYALAIESYSDADSTPFGKDDFYPLEALPFIKTVYAQCAYEKANAAATNWTVKTNGKAMAIELGNPFDRPIAIGAADGPRIKVVIKNNSNAVKAEHEIPATAPDIKPRDFLIVYSKNASSVTEGGSGYNIQTHHFAAAVAKSYAAPDNTFTFDTNDQIIKVELHVWVENATGGKWVAYDKLDFTSFKFQNSFGITASPAPTAGAVRFVQGAMTRDCKPNTIRYITNLGKGLTNSAANTNMRNINTVGTYQSGTNYKLADTTNTRITGANPGESWLAGSGTARIDDLQIPMANRRFFNVAELGHIFMVGFKDTNSTNTTESFPQRISGDGPGALSGGDLPSATSFGGSTRHPQRWFLDISQKLPANTTPAEVTAAYTAHTSGPKIPHAAIVLSEFTTLSPAKDGLNNSDPNDISPSDTASEQFVPGTININTAPLLVATLACPLPEKIQDVQALMQSIFSYRDNPTITAATTAKRYRESAKQAPPSNADVYGTPNGANNTLTWRDEPGIAGIGELIFVNPPIPSAQQPTAQTIANTSDAQRSQMMRRWGRNNSGDANSDATSAAFSLLDLYPLPEHVTNTGATPALANGISRLRLPNAMYKDEAEENMARFQFLSQTFTTRSDIFTAYVVIRGYRVGAFNEEPVESVRFMVVFDRSQMTSNDPAQMIIYGPYSY